MTEIQALREEIRQLHLKRAQGDIRERAFQRDVGQRTTALYRARVRDQMTPDETILEEHHVIQAYVQPAKSVLKEPVQRTVSLFLTDRTLFRLRSTLVPGKPVTCDQRDGTSIDQIALERIQGFRLHRQVRPGEAWVGLAIAAIGGLFYSWLSLTGPVMLTLGVLGFLHGLLLPTRWLEIVTDSGRDPFAIHTPRKKSARRLLDGLRERSCGLEPQLARV